MDSEEQPTMRNFIACTLYSQGESRSLRWAGHVARMEEGRSGIKILTGKPIGKRPLGRPRRKWDIIKLDL